MASIQGIFLLDREARGNITASLYPISSFANPPQKNDPMPSGGLVATVLTGSANGGDGAYRFTNVPPGEYYAAISYAGSTFYEYHNATSVTSGGIISANNYARAVASVTSTYSIPLTGGVVFADCTNGGFTVTLPDASQVPGVTFTVVKTDTTGNVLTIAGASAPQTINGNASISTASPHTSFDFLSSGSLWIID